MARLAAVLAATYCGLIFTAYAAVMHILDGKARTAELLFSSDEV